MNIKIYTAIIHANIMYYNYYKIANYSASSTSHCTTNMTLMPLNMKNNSFCNF